MPTRLPRPVLIGVLAIATAIAIWVLAADAIRRSTTLDPKEIESLLVLLATGCLLDAFIGYRAIRGRVGVVAYGWLGIRILLSAVGLLLLTLPIYAIAALALSRYRAPATADPAATEPDDPAEPAAGPHA